MLTRPSKKYDYSKLRRLLLSRECTICGSKAIGINFGVLTCAPCKAFFRRNAHRREILHLPCQFFEENISKNGRSGQPNDHKATTDCPEVRHCTPCRLRRCFKVGMKVELVRTEEEKQRYKRLIEENRQRRKQLLKLSEDKSRQYSQLNIFSTAPLTETDWKILSNIVYSYDNSCLKSYTQTYRVIFNNKHSSFDAKPPSKISHYKAMHMNNITSFVKFISSIPIAQAISSDDHFYLCQYNASALLFLNLHEIEQMCFTEAWQVMIDDSSNEYVYGKKLFDSVVKMKRKARDVLIADPVVTRLWLVILFFSTPLLYYQNHLLPEISQASRLNINRIQQMLTELLWTYLLHRHNNYDAIRIFSNFMYVYLQMQHLIQAIDHEIQTRSDLTEINRESIQANTASM